jgi:hypothetical protein
MRNTRREFETITNGPALEPAALTEALDAWARADGGRVTAAVVHLLTKAGLAESWPMFSEHLSIQLFTDPDDPEGEAYPVARVLEWSALHNAIPTNEVGKSAFAMFVYARALGDRGFVVCLSDLLEGMEPRTRRVVHEANAIRFALPVDPEWKKHGKQP